MLSTLLKRLVANHGFMNAEDVAQLAELDRLRQCLVRCNGGRFVTAAQCVQHYVDIIGRDFNALYDGDEPEQGTKGTLQAVARGADWVRDVSLLSTDRAFQGDYRPVTAPPMPRQRPVPSVKQIAKRLDAAMNDFRENDCGGVFDGFGVTSDADPGL